MKKVVISGAAGFIGSNLCDKLLEHGFQYGLDNLITGSINNLKHINSKGLNLLNMILQSLLKLKIN